MRVSGVSWRPNKRLTDGHVSDKLFLLGLGFLNVVRWSGGLEPWEGVCLELVKRDQGFFARRLLVR